MSADRWTAALCRITSLEPDNLDALLGPCDPRAGQAGRDIFPADAGLSPFASEFRDPGTVAIGVRIAEPPADLAGYAAQLCAFALERQAEVVVLSHLDYSGLERFGFRTERIAGQDQAARQACEAQARSFWNLEVVV